ncbi:MAG: DUF3794 domain-containing protein [Ruminococcaceae bacterium]|nr:DUF3794 domain-containing protein [Oscillospiraceae bacterium]
MEYNTLNEEYGELELLASDKSVLSELSGDFSLPDYQPEIKRLLRVTASMLPPSKYFGAGEAEFAGNIDYYVLYMGSDNEVYCAPLTGEYSVSVPIEKDDNIDLGNDLITEVKIVPDMIGGRVTSPRHITIKCRLKAHARIYGKKKVMSGVTRCDGSIEKLKDTVQNSSLLLGVGETIHISDEIIPDLRDGEFRVICADGKVLVNEVSAGKDEVICRGELHLKLLTSRENGSLPSSFVRRMPFSGIVSNPGITPDASVYAKGTLSELTLTVDEGRIYVEAGVMLETVGQQNQAVAYISDIYSTTNESNCSYDKVKVPRGISGFNRNFTFSESISLSETSIQEGASVADACGYASVDEYKFEGNKCKMIGKCRFNLQLFDGRDYSNAEIEMPFKYECEMPETASAENTECEAEASMISCRGRIDGDRVGLDAEIALCGRMWENKPCTVLESYSLGEELSGDEGRILVCYPNKNDTLWSVAKRYNTPISQIAQNNKLSQNARPDNSESLSGTQYLVI